MSVNASIVNDELPIVLYATVTTFDVSVTPVTTVPTAISLRVWTTPLASDTKKLVFELDAPKLSILNPVVAPDTLLK